MNTESVVDAMDPQQRATYDVVAKHQKDALDRHLQVMNEIHSLRESLKDSFREALADHSAEDRAMFQKHGDSILEIVTQRKGEKDAADRQEQLDRNAFFERSTWITLSIAGASLLAAWFSAAHGWFK